jgi:hypothetical protein
MTRGRAEDRQDAAASERRDRRHFINIVAGYVAELSSLRRNMISPSHINHSTNYARFSRGRYEKGWDLTSS